MEIDGQNKTVVFSGYVNGLTVFPNPNGNKIIVLTNFNTSREIDNLYSINLRN